MSAIVDIGKNTFSAVIRNKVLYLAGFLLILVVGIAILPIAMIRMVGEGDQQDMARQLQVNLIVGIFGFWNVATLVMAIFLGATAISSEVRARTIITVLSKPLDRWRFVVGKWLGIQVALAMFLTLGLSLSTAILFAFELYPSGLFWFGVLRSFIMVMIMSSLALLIGTFSSAVFAGGFTLLLGMLTGMIAQAVDAPFAWAWLPARAYYFLAPARMPGNLLREGFSSDLLNPEYGLYLGVLTENLLYGLVLVVVSCAIFTTREVRVR